MIPPDSRDRRGDARLTYRRDDRSDIWRKTYENFDVGDMQAMNTGEVRNMMQGCGFCFVAEAHYRPVPAVLYETESDAHEARELIAKALEKAVAITPQG
jgi:hypothetical protein